MTQVDFEIRDDVAVLSLVAPPSNAMTRAMRQALVRALTRAGSEPGVRAVLLRGAGETFCEGAELGEYAHPQQEPRLREICSLMETMDKPVLAAMHGAARGPGMELALASDYRIAAERTWLALPEVLLGLIPSGGATQRLPRLIGAAPSLDLMYHARGWRADDKRARPLIDATFQGDVTVAGLAFLRKLLDEGGGARPTRARRVGLKEPMKFQEEIASALEGEAATPIPARRHLVRAVEAAQLLPFDTGVAYEAELAETCRISPQSQALRHLFAAERRASQPAAATGGEARSVKRLGITGGGPRAVGFAVLALGAGRSVTLHASDADVAQDIGTQVASHFERAGAPDPEWRARLATTSDITGLAECGAIIATSGADAEHLAGVLQRGADVLGGGVPLCIIGPGSEAQQVAAIAPSLASRIVALGVRDPIHLARLIEVSPLAETSADTVATVMRLLRALSRVGVVTAPGDMTAGQSMMRAWQAMALALSDHGVHPHRIDAVLRAEGFAAGPFMAMDVEGLEAARDGLRAAAMPISPTLDALIAAGLTGRTTSTRRDGRGLYIYPHGADMPVPDDAVDALLPSGRGRDMPDAAIVRLANAAMANRGARLLRREVVAQASDLDVAMVAGWGYPRHLGGPMKNADMAGLFSLMRLLEQFAAATDGRHWMPDRLLRDIVKNGGAFTG